MPDALGAPQRVDQVVLIAIVDRFIRTFRLTDIAVDALGGDLKCHRRSDPALAFFCQTPLEDILNTWVNEMADITTVVRNLPDQR